MQNRTKAGGIHKLPLFTGLFTSKDKYARLNAHELRKLIITVIIG